jgi:hypothetical protein
MAGKAEKYVRDLFRKGIEQGWWLKKNTDWNKVIGAKEEGVDYNLALASIQVEVKNTDKDGVLTDRISEVQAELLDRYGGFVFLVMWDEGYPRLPGGADAYLVPWEVYKWFDEETQKQRKSIRRHKGFRAYGADEYLADYILEWKDGRFAIPPDHPFWDTVLERVEVLQEQTDSIRTWRSSALEGVVCDVGKG